MLTFDNISTTTEDPLKDLLKKNTPDQIECGENNEHWVFVRRSTGMIELVSKHTGVIVAKCTVNGATTYGLTSAQVSAARAGLLL